MVPGDSWLPFNKSFCWKTMRSRCIRGFVSQIKKNSCAKKRMSTSSFRSSRVISFKSSKANNKVNFTLPLSGKKNSTHDGQYIQSFHFWRKAAFKPEKSWAQHKIINLRQLTKEGNSIFLSLIYRNLIWSNIFLQPFNYQKWLKSNFSFQYPYIVQQTINENTHADQVDVVFMKRHQIIVTNLLGNLKQPKRRINSQILRVKG